eukprot:scaffold197279_cov37-Prasinocladus_malaysianus.AAC.1
MAQEASSFTNDHKPPTDGREALIMTHLQHPRERPDRRVTCDRRRQAGPHRPRAGRAVQRVPVEPRGRWVGVHAAPALVPVVLQRKGKGVLVVLVGLGCAGKRERVAVQTLQAIRDRRKACGRRQIVMKLRPL